MNHKSSSDPLFNPERAAAGVPFPFDTAVTGLVDVTAGPIDFDPVPRLRNRRNGWTPGRQRVFIDCLAECGCVARAARAVSMSPRSAYRLLESEGAESFAEAWDQAIARGIEKLRADAIGRAIGGAWVPIVRKGRIVRQEFRHNDRLAIALLSGRKGSVADNRERASSRRKHRMKLLAEKRRQEDKRKAAERVWAEHQSILDAIEAELENPQPSPIRNPPRIRRI
jgi:hypothetical protein